MFQQKIDSLDEIRKTKETEVQELQAALNKEIESVKTFRQELQALLDQLEQQTIEILRNKCNKIEESIAEDITKVKQVVSSLNEAESQLKKAGGNKAQEFVCVKFSQALTIKAKKEETTQLVATYETVSFSSYQGIKTLLQQYKALGKTLANKPFTPKESLYKVSQEREIYVKLKDDTDLCSISGSCITDDGSLLLSDRSNNKLKRIDMSTELVKDYINLKEPLDVCTVSNTEAAVALYSQTVQFVSLEDKMTATQTFTMKHHCHGLAHKEGNCSYLTEVKQYTYEG